MSKEIIGYDERFPRARSDVMCAECGAPMRIIQGQIRPYYSCTNYPECRGTHSAHPDGSPMGIPAGKNTRSARAVLHRKFDRMWQDGRMSRQSAYVWLQIQMKMTKDECHIGKFDMETCLRAMKIVDYFLDGE